MGLQLRLSGTIELYGEDKVVVMEAEGGKGGGCGAVAERLLARISALKGSLACVSD